MAIRRNELRSTDRLSPSGTGKRALLLDCTLRDGSYEIDFGFTADDTVELCRALEEAGLPYIEVGHGNGLGASEKGVGGVAAASDRDYLRAARRGTRRARVGAFFIPGIADESHLALAAAEGADFIRIGTNANESEQALPFIRAAKALGLETHYNAMKSYLISAAELALRADALADAGADVISVVDSAGGMLPGDVAMRVAALVEAVSIPVGFHGHHNLMMADANNLAALEAGALFVDSTLQGMGRSGGNAHTEVMVPLCERLGIQTGVDLDRCFAAAAWLQARRGGVGALSALNVTLGATLMHSSFVPRIARVAARYGLEDLALIRAVAAVDRAAPSDAQIEAAAVALAAIGVRRQVA